jgi:hypothetical protein
MINTMTKRKYNIKKVMRHNGSRMICNKHEIRQHGMTSGRYINLSYAHDVYDKK